MDTLQTLLALYIVLLVLNSIVAFTLWLIYRTRPFLALLGLWLFTLINFVLQSLSLDANYLSILYFSSYFPAAWCLTLVLQNVSGFSMCFRPYLIGYLFAIAFTSILSLFTSIFWILSLPVAIAIAVPQIHFSIKKLFYFRKTGPALNNMFALVLLLNGIHFLDYPFLREHEIASVIGFGLVIVFSALFTALLPAIVSTHHAMLLTKQQEELAEARSEFLAVMGHEVRSPIGGIIGMIELMKFTEISKIQEEYCDRIESCALNLMNITTNILSSSEMESKSITVHIAPFSPSRLASEIIDHYSVKIKYSESIVDCDVITPMPVLLCSDEGKIRQILYNLVDNALKYNHGSHIKIKIRYQGNRLNLVVSDNGAGIKSEVMDRIFLPLEQFNNDKRDGVGLGLSIVKGLLTSLSGEITVSSEIDKGSTFSVYIPVEEVPKE